MSGPTRLTDGLTQAGKFQPLGEVGITDPLFYSSYYDDFLPYSAGDYTVTATGGSVAPTEAFGNGGRVLLTTAATANSFAMLQLPGPSFQNIIGLKLFYLVRFRVNNVVNDPILAGFLNTSTNPFLAASTPDGIFFQAPAGFNNLYLMLRTGGVTVTQTSLPNNILSNNVDIDLGFSIDKKNIIRVYAGPNLEGVKRQNTANLGPILVITSPSITSRITSAILTPTLAIGDGGAGGVATMAADFQFAGLER